MPTNPGSIIGGGIQPLQRNRRGSIGGPQIGDMGLQGQLGNYMNLINKGMYGDQQRASYMGGYSPSMFGSFQPQSAGKQWGFAGNLPNYSPAIGLNNLGYKAGLQDTNAPGATPFQATAPGFSRAMLPTVNEAERYAVSPSPYATPAMQLSGALSTPNAGYSAGTGGMGGAVSSGLQALNTPDISRTDAGRAAIRTGTFTPPFDISRNSDWRAQQTTGRIQPASPNVPLFDISRTAQFRNKR